jgi:2'-5' RNA ligase
MTTRRIFVALPVSEEIAETSTRVARHFPDVPVRWVGRRDLHITMVAPWVSTDIEEDKKIFSRALHYARPFTIRFGVVEPGPTIVAPRLIWIKGKTDGSYAASLQKQLALEFDRSHDFKKWLPHVTIGRFQKDTSATSPIRTVYEKVDITERISRMCLMESRESPEGMRYSILAEAEFGS